MTQTVVPPSGHTVCGVCHKAIDVIFTTDLNAVTREVLEQVEDLSGKGIEFIHKDNLPILTTKQTARHGAP